MEGFAVQLLWILTAPITDLVDNDGSFSEVTVHHVQSYLGTVPLQVMVLGHPLACRFLTQKIDSYSVFIPFKVSDHWYDGPLCL